MLRPVLRPLMSPVVVPLGKARRSGGVNRGLWTAQKGTNLVLPFVYNIAKDGSNVYGSNVYSPAWSSTKAGLYGAKLAAQGHDHVRLNFEIGPFLEAIANADAARLNTLFGLYTVAVDDLIEYGVKVLVSPMNTLENPLWTASEVLNNGTKWGYYQTLITECATRFASYRTDLVALSLFNEPVPGFSTPTWQTYAELLYDLARAQMPDHTLTICGSVGGGDEDGLLVFDPSHFDDRTLYVPHHYAPPIFTHQAQSWHSPGKYVVSPNLLNWPPDGPSVISAKITAAKALVDADGALSAGQKTAVKAEIDQQIGIDYAGYSVGLNFADVSDIARWATTNGVPWSRVYWNEFGTSQNGPSASNVAWLRDTREAIEAYGMTWASFTWDADNLGLTDADGDLLTGYADALFGATTALHADTSTLVAAMVSPPDAQTQRAIDAVIRGLVSDSTWSTLGYLGLYMAHTKQAALLNWKAPAVAPTEVGTLTFAVDVAMSGNGSSTYLDTNYSMFSGAGKPAQGNGMFALMNIDGGDSDNDAGGADGNFQLGRHTGYGAFNLGTYAREYGGLAGTDDGFLGLVSRAATSYEKYDHLGNSVGTTTITAGNNANDLWVWRAADGYSASKIGMVAAGSQLTSDQMYRLWRVTYAYARYKGQIARYAIP